MPFVLMVADVGVADVTVEVVAGEVVVMLSRRKRGGLVRGGGAARPVESEAKDGLLSVVVGDEIDALVVAGDSVWGGGGSSLGWCIEAVPLDSWGSCGLPLNDRLLFMPML